MNRELGSHDPIMPERAAGVTPAAWIVGECTTRVPGGAALRPAALRARGSRVNPRPVPAFVPIVTDRGHRCASRGRAQT